MSALLRTLDSYLDAVPRPYADAVGTGAFTLFVSRTPAGFYARPTLGHPGPIGPVDIEWVGRVCAERGVPLEIEWIDELHPELAGVAAGAGLSVRGHDLLVAPGDLPARPPGPGLRVLGADDPKLPLSRAVAEVAFRAGGTGPGPEGTAEAERVELSPATVDHLRDRIRRGLGVTMVAEDGDDVLAVGSYRAVRDTAEILMVATLPSARRRGLAGALTTALAHHARAAGVRTVLLSAENTDVSRLYRSLGFRRVGTVRAAGRP